MKLPWHSFHFVGMGGIGMSGLAEILLELGYKVSGSDINDSALLRRLSNKGSKVYIGHRAEQINDAEVVIFSSAIKQDNPEIIAARKKNLLILSRGELLALLMSQKRGIAIAGTHGKTTTSAMIATILEKAGFSPTVIIGGRMNGNGLNAWLGKGEFLIAEADESDESFLLLEPEIAVVTNIDADHLDHYSDIKAIEIAFAKFLKKVKNTAIICEDDERLRNIKKNLNIQILTYGFSNSQFEARNLKLGATPVFDLYFQNKKIKKIFLPLPGKHNVSNALAALAVAYALNIELEIAIAGLEEFKGVGRRMEIKGEKNGIIIVDDYAHHPAEIKVLLSAIRQKWPNRRIVTIFQPHRYSRTKALYESFLSAFNETDELILTEIYSAGETPIPEISGEKLAKGIAQYRTVYYFPDFNNILDKLPFILKPGDILLTVGAGNIWQVGEMFLKQ